MRIEDRQKCKLCEGFFSVREILDRAEFYWPEVDVVVCASPCCPHTEEVRVENEKVWRGYVYGAGGPHFSAEEEYVVPGLEVQKFDKGIRFSLAESFKIEIGLRQ